MCLLLRSTTWLFAGIEHKAIVDVISATGFVLRLLAGVYAVDDLPTSWITLARSS